MYLKNIEINGFKSFANKINFDFPHGITGIVGPNGSGKSNIGDAVRWVLGEQSAKQLRGSKMEDVIFSGTENRKPMGFAYVAITFDNADRKIALDYDEVKVARRVYRSGESEYLINGSACRRKDIVEIFYDTGIGKEGYSIIGQGQVEKILSGKIEDSRELFDEAAGIAKYKKNRSITEKTLEQERANLERVTDILLELEKQVGPLEKQSEKAKKYLKLRDREKEIDIGLFLYDYENNQAKKEQAQKNFDIVTADKSRVDKNYAAKKEENQRQQEELEALNVENDMYDQTKKGYLREKNTLDDKITQLKHDMDMNALSIQHQEENRSQAVLDKKERCESLEALENNVEEEKLHLEDERAALELLKSEITNWQLKQSKLIGKISAKQDTMIDALSSNTSVKEKLGRFQAMEEQLGIRNAEYNSRLISLQSDMKDYGHRAALLEQELKETHTKWETAQSDYDILTRSCQEKEEKIASLQNLMEEERKDYLKNRSRYDTLVSIHERYEGYNRSIQHIMEQKKNNPDIIGVVADILTMKQEYETAIEIALGGALQNIVTENENCAKQMVQFLKKNKLGRATFLPLTSVRRRGNGLNQGLLREEGAIGIASGLVKADQKFSELIESLLGRTLIVDTMDHALMIARKNGYSVRIVTLDGDLLNPGGSLTGGAYKHSGNLLGRQREIEEIKTKLEESRETFVRQREDLKELQQSLATERENEEARKAELDDMVLKLHDYNTQIPELRDKEEEFKGKIENLKKDHASLLAQLEEIREERKKVSKDQMSSEKVQEENTDAISKLEEEKNAVDEKLSELENQKNEKNVAIAQCEQQLEFYESERMRLNQEIAQCEQSIQESLAATEELKNQNTKCEVALKNCESEQADWVQKIEEVDGSLEICKNKRKDLTVKQNKSYKELAALGEELRLLEKEETRLSNQLEKLTDSLETLINYMWDSYEITYNQQASQINKPILEESQIPEYRKEKKELVHQIKQLGNVNVNAIDEYKEVGERYQFLKQQYDDIKISEERLVGMIEELNKAMKEQFTNSFDEIQSMFTTVFQDLFEGGTASLELMDESNILECGIRIVAQPPGKKLQNILLLSGGEKALTAIALLFAIQNLKPSPFCLLDEIEAALDDANIVRFAKYLKKLSKDTQFIVITHRRGTMNAADSLYGITMQEKGISTLISVDLIDTELN